MRGLALVALLSTSAWASAEKPATLRGGVYLRGDRSPLAGARVMAVGEEAWKNSNKGTKEIPVDAQFSAEADEKGIFSVTLPAGRYHVVVQAPKAKRFEANENLSAGDTLTVKYFLEPSQYQRYESTVRADFNREEISRKTLTTEEIVRMPGSQGDALRSVTNLPGVARPPFNAGLFIIRGGKPTDSRGYVGTAEVPQLFHFGGFTSVFPAALIERIDFFPGNFGVRYGRAIAGTIDVELREGKRDRIHGALETNAFDTGVMLEGPLPNKRGKEKGSFVLAARRSYIDALMGAIIPKDAGLNFSTAPVYYDYQAMLDYPVGGGKLRLLISGSDDQLKLLFERPNDADPAITSFGTHIWYHKALLRWTRNWGKWQFLLQNSTGFTGQDGTLGRALNFNVWSVNTDFRLEARWIHSPRLRFLFGADMQYANVHLEAAIPPPPREGQIPAPISATQAARVNEVLNVGLIALYAEATWKPHARVTIVPGLRFDYFTFLERTALQPRLSARVQVAKYTTLKAGVGLFSQDPQPPDYNAAFGNPRVRPESALHTSLGVEQGLLPGLMLELTGFYKHLYDLVAPTANLLIRDGQVAAERVASDGIGRIYGGEVLLRQSLSKWFFGWVSYTLMRSERKDCAACDWRLFDFDQTHIFIVAGSVYLPKGFGIGARFRYISGIPFTPARGGWYDSDVDVYSPAQGPVNTGRLEAFHSLDLRVDKTFLFKTWQLKLYLDITNLYNRGNPELAQYNFDFTKNIVITGLPIIPSFGIRGEF